jgi:phosphohistidine phosphatase
MPAGATVHLVRHGAAAPAGQDGERPLTAEGRDAVARLADWCAAHGVAPHAIRHSGILRAAQTAEILAARLAPPEGVRAVRGLAPDDDPQRWADELPHETGSLMLVTHAPFIVELASLLVPGQAGRGARSFAPGAIACIERTPGGWRLAATWAP